MDPNLKNLRVHIKADGFRLDDNGCDIQEGTPLEVRYELRSGWVTKIIEFERDARTLLHPFRKSMFVYTGEQPYRVLVRLAGVPRRRRTFVEDRRAFYRENNFSSYPDFDDVTWTQEDYSPLFFSDDQPPVNEFVPGGGEFGGAGASGEWEQSPEATQSDVRQSDDKPQSAEPVPNAHHAAPQSETGAAPAGVDPLDAAVAACEAASSLEDQVQDSAVAADADAGEGPTPDGDNADQSEPNAY
ncbi:hypothetical protein ACXR0O_12285 [Verrucomicrobiota bacterium sgz303538]